MKLKNWIFKPLSKVINKVLGFDREVYTQITLFAGKSLAVTLKDWDMTCYVLIASEGIELKSDYEGVITTSVSGKSLDLINMLRSHSNNNDREVTLTGDIEFLQELKALILRLDIDWEEQMAQFSGDIIAHEIMRKLRRAHEWFKQSSASFQRNVTEYLQEEIQFLVSRAECEHLFEDVAHLRNAVERAQVRLTRLSQQRIAKGNKA